MGACESAYSCAYYNTISWRNDTTPLPMENRPRAIFERLFGDAGTTDPKSRLALRQEDRSILDAVTDDVTTAARQARRRRTAARSTSIWKRSATSSGASSWRRRRATTTLPDARAARPASRRSFSEYYKLMTDLMVLAWQTDMTRVCTFQIGHEMSGRAYPEVGFGDAHHSVTHHQGDAEKIAKVIQINIFHTKLLAYYLEKLRSTPDGDGSLLDHSHDALRRRDQRRQSAPLHQPADCC